MKNSILKSSILPGIFIAAVMQGCTPGDQFDRLAVTTPAVVNVGPVDYFLQPYFIDISDSLILVSDKGHDRYFHFLDTVGMAPVMVYGEKGVAPESITFRPVLSHPAFNNRHLVYYDFGRVSIRYISVAKLMDGGEPLPDRYYFLSPELVNAQNVLAVNDTLIVCSGGLHQGKLCFNEPLGGNMSFISFTPHLKDMDPSGYPVIYHSTIAASPDRSVIVSAMLYFKVIEIYTAGGHLIRQIKGENSFRNTFMVRGQITSDDTYMHYLDVFVTDSAIYAIHAGVKSGVLNGTSNPEDLSVHIEAYTHLGEPLANYLLDQPVTSVAVDEEARVIYGINPLNERQPLVRINL